jgi:hypothetical protein
MTPEEEFQSFAVPQAISATVQRYIDGARDGDVALLRSAFTNGARVSGSYSAKGGPAPSLQARVVSMEHAGGAAMARLEALDWRGTRYTDFFVLIHEDGDWRIDSKVFFAHRKA